MSIFNKAPSGAFDMKEWLLLNIKQEMLVILWQLCFSFPYPNRDNQISCLRAVADGHREKQCASAGAIMEARWWLPPLPLEGRRSHCSPENAAVGDGWCSWSNLVLRCICIIFHLSAVHCNSVTSPHLRKWACCSHLLPSLRVSDN